MLLVVVLAFVCKKYMSFFFPFCLINVFVMCEMALDRGYSVEGFSGQNVSVVKMYYYFKIDYICCLTYCRYMLVCDREISNC